MPSTSRLAPAERGAAYWAEARRALDGLPGGGLNIAHEAVDRHVVAGRGGQVALQLLPRRGPRRPVTYAELAELTNRFANVLLGSGVAPGERVFVLTGRVLDEYVAVLGALKARCVACPLFSAFGPEPIRQRLALGDGRVLVTTAELYARKVAPQRAALPGLTHVFLTEPASGKTGPASGKTGPASGKTGPADPGAAAAADTLALGPLLAAASPAFRIPPTAEEDPALLHFTSGTTGTPKGALHVHGAVVAHHATGRDVLGLGEGDVFWCTADPGWVTGTSYGIVAPLTCGSTSIVDEADFDAERWYATLADQRVAVWYTAPTAIRMLMRAGDDLARSVDLSHLRHVASVGEPLHAAAVQWGADVLGQPIRDTWWQTETGGIMIANDGSQASRRGSMGVPLPGVEAAVLACDDEGALVPGPAGEPIEVAGSGTPGMLALRRPWPSMFRAYIGEPERYRRSFSGEWYLSGDLVRRDDEGYFWFVARADDVIKTAGHLIGPSEVEQVLLAHPAVAEAGAYGVPDPVAGAVVHAAVVLRADADAVAEADALRSVLAHARSRLGAAVAPRQLIVVEDVPKTRSGKILRRVLRARELGLPEGDLSMLEPVPGGAT